MTAPRLRYFDYAHLPPRLQDVSEPFKVLAEAMLTEADVDEDEIEMGLRKLLEAKDCFVRAHLRRPDRSSLDPDLGGVGPGPEGVA